MIGRVGRWCFRHGWWVLAAWLVAVVAGVLATGPLFSRLSDSRPPSNVESITATDVISAGNDSAGTIIAIVDGVDPNAAYNPARRQRSVVFRMTPVHFQRNTKRKTVARWRSAEAG